MYLKSNANFIEFLISCLRISLNFKINVRNKLQFTDEDCGNADSFYAKINLNYNKKNNCVFIEHFYN